jgi:DNA helicase-2/ATP-dependent DNA helicase PcrA
VVGDDAQAIYGFRAADVRNILDFPGRFAPPARIVTLERNYRSTAPILAAANAVIAEAREGYAKHLAAERPGGTPPRLVALRDEIAQADYVCDVVLAAREEGTVLKSQAVLFRAAHHSSPLEVELTRRNIPFVKFGGLKFLEAAHVKDLLALLRFAENPRDRIAGFRALQLLPGVGPGTAAAVMAAMAEASDPGLALPGFPVPKRAAPDWPGFAALFATLRTGPAWPADVAAARLFYEPQLERLHEDAAVRRADLVQLEAIAATYPSRARFLTELTLDAPDATSDRAGVPLRDEDYLILSTIHSAKGQEWSQVFVLNCVDGCIPSDLGTGTSAEIDEERRLLYVAMTRARDSLHLMLPQRFYTHGQPARGDRHVYASRSRFLPDHVLDGFERLAWPPRPAATTPRPVETRDLKARMRGMWG